MRMSSEAAHMSRGSLPALDTLTICVGARARVCVYVCACLTWCEFTPLCSSEGASVSTYTESTGGMRGLRAAVQGQLARGRRCPAPVRAAARERLTWHAASTGFMK